MEQKRELEIQLGHLCNNRCVFCISGLRTHQRLAPLLPADLIKRQILEAHRSGVTRLTLLGGEPTAQPFFLEVVRYAVSLGFHEIVVFTNGSRTGRTDLMDEVLATGGRFEWRFSFQGATEEAHERTTRRKGSFAQLVESLARARDRGQKVSVNMCVVRQNYESLEHFPALLAPYGVRQLHVDMLHPDDMGEVPDEQLREMMPRYSELVGPLTRMVRGFPEGFDVNIGNLPYCVAPELAPWIRHGGQPTWTISVNADGRATLYEPWNKYVHKQRSKFKPETCFECAFHERCSGVFPQYASFHGLDELRPVSRERLAEVDPQRRLFALRLGLLLEDLLEDWAPPAPFESASATETRLTELVVTFRPRRGDEARLVVALRPPGEAGCAATDLASLEVVDLAGDPPRVLSVLRAFWERVAGASRRVLHPLGDDILGTASPLLAAEIRRLRARAPYGRLTWSDLRLHDAGSRAELTFDGAPGERAVVWLTDRGGRRAGGYRVEPQHPSPELVGGLREVLEVLEVRRKSRDS